MGKKIFVSYANNDRWAERDLAKHLAPLAKELSIEVYSDALLTAGTKWRSQLARWLHDADIVVVLVSPSALASTSVLHEILGAISAGKLVVPVLVEPCDFAGSPLAKFQIVPRDPLGRLMPVREWDSTEEAWQQVVNDLAGALRTEASNPERGDFGATTQDYRPHERNPGLAESASGFSPQTNSPFADTDGSEGKTINDQPPERVAAWLFQFKPGDHVERLIAGGFIDNLVLWKAKQVRGRARPGDIAFIWQAGRDGGLRGWGELTTGKEVDYDHPSDGNEPRIELLGRCWLDPLVPRGEVKSKALADHSIFRMAQGTNFALSEAQRARLIELLPQDVPRPGVARRSLLSRIKTLISREIEKDSETGLQIDVHALALATLFRTAQGEFCFALLGHWGIGKTFLAKRVAKLLEQPQEYLKKMEASGLKVRDESDKSLVERHEVVWYSAWKYRRAPEIWVYLYESFADICRKRPFPARIPTFVRSAQYKFGSWSLPFSLLLLGLTILSLVVPQELLGTALSVFGLGGVLLLARVIRHTRETTHGLLRRFAQLTSHRDKLGAQATIGADLVALLRGWMPQRGQGWPTTLLTGAILFVVPACYWMLLHNTVPSTVGSISTTYTWLHEILAELGVGQPAATGWVSQGLIALWLVASLCLLWSPLLSYWEPAGVLLVVDDLDRCPPEEIVEVVESLKLLLEDPEIKSRVQILMLIDEQVLEHAIALKFQKLIEQKQASAGDSEAASYREQLVDEHMEKLFTCGMRLPNLTQSEIAGLAHLYGTADHSPKDWQSDGADPQITPSTDRPGREEISQSDASTARSASGLQLGPGTASAATAQPPQLPKAFDVEAARFLPEEVQQLTKLLPRLAQERRREHVLTPREIRSFLFKAQMARLLLELSGKDTTDTTALFEHLGKIVFCPDKTLQVGPTDRLSMDAVIRQVA